MISISNADAHVLKRLLEAITGLPLRSASTKWANRLRQAKILKKKITKKLEENGKNQSNREH